MGVSAALWIAGSAANTATAAMALTSAAGIKAAHTASKALIPTPKMPGMPDFDKGPTNPAPSTQSQASAQAAQRQRSQARSAYGGGDTILTGPLGLVNDPNVKRKSLLGA